VIKRGPSLSLAHGGSVAEIEAEPGKMRRMTTYCRFYQTHPIKRSILCLGYLDYPPCPDLERCKQNPRPKSANYVEFVPSDG
jgi:hypothetical protein